MENKNRLTILFYTTVPRLFRSTLFGHLYYLAQTHNIILLSESLDQQTASLVRNKKLFPGISRIVQTNQYGKAGAHGLFLHAQWIKLAKKICAEYKFDVVITDNDFLPLELYLIRYGKKRYGALALCVQSALWCDNKTVRAWRTVMTAYRVFRRYPKPLHLWITQLRKKFAHLFIYWIAPFIAGEMPFKGKSNLVEPRGMPGMRQADYFLVFTEQQKEVSINAGVPMEKITVLPHPLADPEFRGLIKKHYFETTETRKKTLTIMIQVEGVSINSRFQIIDERRTDINRAECVSIIAHTLRDWKIFIKPHPGMHNFQEIKTKYESLASNITVTDPDGHADYYINISEIIAGFPPPSTTMFSAALQCPPKIILSLNTSNEILGDVFASFPEITYIDTLPKLRAVLKQIKDGSFKNVQMKIKTGNESKNDAISYKNITEAVSDLYQKYQLAHNGLSNSH